jgi:hypothetical protein
MSFIAAVLSTAFIYHDGLFSFASFVSQIWASPVVAGRINVSSVGECRANMESWRSIEFTLLEYTVFFHMRRAHSSSQLRGTAYQNSLSGGCFTPISGATWCRTEEWNRQMPGIGNQLWQ